MTSIIVITWNISIMKKRIIKNYVKVRKIE